MVIYVKGDLFSAPETQLLVHACNCQGVWGSGVARQFNERFQVEYKVYRNACKTIWDGGMGIGKSLIVNRVGCLFTSVNYGDLVDSPDKILANTKSAMDDLLSKTTMDLAMPKINSGLFKVPWEETEKILNSYDRDIYVYVP